MSMMTDIKEGRNYVLGSCLRPVLRVSPEATLKIITLTDHSYNSSKAIINHCTWHAYRKPYVLAKRKIKHNINTGADLVMFAFDGIRHK